jgi:hypothetical protein
MALRLEIQASIEADWPYWGTVSCSIAPSSFEGASAAAGAAEPPQEQTLPHHSYWYLDMLQRVSSKHALASLLPMVKERNPAFAGSLVLYSTPSLMALTPSSVQMEIISLPGSGSSSSIAALGFVSPVGAQFVVHGFNLNLPQSARRSRQPSDLRDKHGASCSFSAPPLPSPPAVELGGRVSGLDHRGKNRLLRRLNIDLLHANLTHAREPGGHPATARF